MVFQDPQTNSLISRYNYSRRVVDHRIPHDLNHAANKSPLHPMWFASQKQRFVSKMVQNFSMWFAAYGVFLGFGLAIWDAYAREDTKNPSALFHSRQQWGQRFIWNHRNQDTDLGRWNHNFYCYEREPNCGRDFD